MASRTAFLAVALSLAILLLVFVVVCILLLLFTRNIDQKYNKDLLQLNEELDEAKSTLSIYPWAKKRGIAGDNLPIRRTVQESFGTFAFLLGSYAVSWVNEKGSSSFGSSAHIESILFPKPAQTNGQDDDGSSPFIFPNPHRYTPSEIQSLLQQDGTRSSMFQHIVSSVILQNVSVNGPPGQTILPLLPEELRDLKRMLELIQGLPCMFLSLQLSLELIPLRDMTYILIFCSSGRVYGCPYQRFCLSLPEVETADGLRSKDSWGPLRITVPALFRFGRQYNTTTPQRV